MNDLNLNPLCIILVKSGAHGGKLLFRYPHSSAAPPTPTHTPARRNPYSMIISEDLLNHRADVEPSNIKDCQLTGFSDETLANIFAVSKSLCGSKFELKLNDVRFVGHPISLEPDENVEKDPRRTPLTMFHVVFALRAQCNYSIIPCYHELSERLGVILKREEERVGYLTQQMRCLMDIQDEVGRLPEVEQQQDYQLSLALERSHLARDIQTIYKDLCTSGEVRLYINKWVELSFCLPQKLHKRHFPGILVEPESIYECLEALRPYHCLLLLEDAHDLLDSLSTDSSPALRRIIRQCSPLRSLRTLAVDTDLSLMQVFQQAGHLLYWGKATVIYPLCECNLYVLSPHLPTPLPLRLSNQFSERFGGDSLLETLSNFSLPCQLAVSPPLALHQPRQIEVIVWLLQHHLVIQLHTYVSLALDSRMTFTCQSPKLKAPIPVPPQLVSKAGSEVGTGSGHSEVEEGSSLGSYSGRRQLDLLEGERDLPVSIASTEQLLSGFSNAEKAMIMKVPAASNPEELQRFASLCKYFRGEHHLEEIMYHENIRRSALLQLIDKFRDILVKVEHEDPAVSMYFRRME